MLELGLKVLISYLAGSLNGSLIVGRLSGGVDIRTMGSGNAGGTNALRTQGKAFAFFVMLIDIGKSAVPVLLLPAMELPGVPVDPEVSRIWLALACGGAAVIGHCYPVWFQFAGGKGAATAIGVLIIVAPFLLVPALLVWAAMLILTGYVGLATIAATVALPLYVAASSFATEHDLLPNQLFWYLVFQAILIIYTHRDNIRRMMQGDEHRLVQAMLFRRHGSER